MVILEQMEWRVNGLIIYHIVPGLIAVCIHPDKATHENIKPVLNCCLFLKYISMKGNVLYLDEVHSISNIVRFWFATTVRNG